MTVQQLYTAKLYNCYYSKDSNQIIFSLSLPVLSRALRTIRAINFQTIHFLKNDSSCDFDNFPAKSFTGKCMMYFTLPDSQKYLQVSVHSMKKHAFSQK